MPIGAAMLVMEPVNAILVGVPEKVREAAVGLLEGDAIAVTAARDADEAIAVMRGDEIGGSVMVLIDGERDGAFRAATTLKADAAQPASIVVAIDSDEDAARASELGVDVIDRPLTPQRLRARLLRAAAAHRDAARHRSRIAELERTNEQLRFADRMATIGTLSAGLGHDMGNLLLPVRIRLDTMLAAGGAEAIREDLIAIRSATQYLQRLARSLRLLAVDPGDEPSADACTEIAAWWPEVGGMIRNAVPRPVVLDAEIPANLPAVRIGETALTQVVFNLVQNAGHAVSDAPAGRVRLTADLAEGGRVRIRIIDNGIGMPEDVRRRCQEPFFTTRTRGLGTGLGLTLSAGLVRRAGGDLDVKSIPGAGTAVTIMLPVIQSGLVRGPSPQVPRAIVEIADRRTRAHVLTLLASQGVEARREGDRDHADLWIVDDHALATDEDIARFAECPRKKAVLLTERPGPATDRCTRIDPRLKPTALRARLLEILAPRTAERATEEAAP